MRKILYISLVLIIIIFTGAFSYYKSIFSRKPLYFEEVSVVSDRKSINLNDDPKIENIVENTLLEIPKSKLLKNDYHIFQTFNNCGPASLSMALSYFSIKVSQFDLGQDIRPYQNTKGNNDDKSVTFDELGNQAKKYALQSYTRPNGSPEKVKQFIANDIPVVTRTLLKKTEDIGHYRVIKGYTESSFIQDDSLQGKDLVYSFDDYNEIWSQYNYEYLVIFPESKREAIERIIGEDIDAKNAWTSVKEKLIKHLEDSPSDHIAEFNLSIAEYYLENYSRSISHYEATERYLSQRTLWYQIEPILAYEKVGNYKRVFEITTKILNNNNRAFSELYIIRGEIYLKQGNENAAKEEFLKARLYNKNIKMSDEAEDLI